MAFRSATALQPECVPVVSAVGRRHHRVRTLTRSPIPRAHKRGLGNTCQSAPLGTETTDCITYDWDDIREWGETAFCQKLLSQQGIRFLLPPQFSQNALVPVPVIPPSLDAGREPPPCDPPPCHPSAWHKEPPFGLRGVAAHPSFVSLDTPSEFAFTLDKIHSTVHCRITHTVAPHSWRLRALQCRSPGAGFLYNILRLRKSPVTTAPMPVRTTTPGAGILSHGGNGGHGQEHGHCHEENSPHGMPTQPSEKPSQ